MKRFGDYELLARLGRGGMAEVWKVRAVKGPQEGREFALKRLLPELEGDPRAVERFAMEAEHARALSHPNIIRVFDVGAVEGAWYQVMELVDGHDLAQLIKRSNQRQVPFPIDFSLMLTHRLCEALDCAHSAKDDAGKPLDLVHCDVAPSNLFLAHGGQVKLGDFGVARARIDGGAGEIFGKPYYVSPEALKGAITPALDLWGAGVVLYELLTQRRPFTGAGAEELFANVRAGAFAPARTFRTELPEAVDLLVRRALAPDPEERFPSARAFATALEGLYPPSVERPASVAAVVRALVGDPP